MDNLLLKGRLVWLTAESEHDIDSIVAWNRDTHFVRLLAVNPVTPPNPKHYREMLERPHNERFYPFGIRTLADDRLIGFVTLMHIDHVHGDCFVGIGIGDGNYRSQGYGSDAMNLALRFAFQELNLRRVSLDAIATNARAIHSYEKVGFVHEGRTRGTEFRNAIRDDLVCMGILRSEWEAKQTA